MVLEAERMTGGLCGVIYVIHSRHGHRGASNDVWLQC